MNCQILKALGIPLWTEKGNNHLLQKAVAVLILVHHCSVRGMNPASFLKCSHLNPRRDWFLLQKNEMDSQESDVESSSGISRPETPTPIYPNDDSDTTHLYTDDSESGSSMNTSTPLADDDIPSENEEPIPAPQPSKPVVQPPRTKKDTSGTSKGSAASTSSAGNSKQKNL